MKTNLLLLFLFVHIAASAQKIEKYFDYAWKPCTPDIARYYALIEFKDNLWERKDYYLREQKLQMKGAYADSACKKAEGPFVYFHSNGRLSSGGNYINGKKDGLWVRYYSNGMMRDSVVYKNGQPAGVAIGWHSNGYPSDSSNYNDDGTAVRIEWFDNGAPSSAGRLLNEKKHGTWVFYHKNGNISAKESYDKGVAVNRQYYDETGNVIADTTNRDRDAEFAGGEKAWRKYLLSKLSFPRGYEITGGDRAIVVVDAVIDEDGKVTDVEVSSPFHPAFDDAAVKMMKNSPRWKPAVRNNRRMKTYVRQPVTFVQSE